MKSLLNKYYTVGDYELHQLEDLTTISPEVARAYEKYIKEVETNDYLNDELIEDILQNTDSNLEYVIHYEPIEDVYFLSLYERKETI